MSYKLVTNDIVSLDAPVMISDNSNYHFLNDRVCAKIKKAIQSSIVYL